MAKSFVERFRRKLSLVAALSLLGVVVLSNTPFQQSLLYDLCILPGILLVFVGVIGRLWCTAYIGGRKNSQLVTDGPYSLWRNPLYVFSFAGLIGILFTTRLMLLALVAVPVYLVYYHCVIRSEEARLRELFGTEYETYCAKVKVVVPAVRNYWTRPFIEINPRFYKNAMADAFMFILALMGIEAIYRLKVLGYIKPLLHFPF